MIFSRLLQVNCPSGSIPHLSNTLLLTSRNLRVLHLEIKTTIRAETCRSALYHHLSSRFCKEYLSLLREIHSLHHRKQVTTENLINVGDIVLVADMNKPCHHWELGLVLELILGTDKPCRAAVVRTPCDRTTRSILKLYPLEANARSEIPPEELPRASNENLTIPRHFAS